MKQTKVEIILPREVKRFNPSTSVYNIPEPCHHFKGILRVKELQKPKDFREL